MHGHYGSPVPPAINDYSGARLTMTSTKSFKFQPGQVTAVVLGIAQDAGLPHIGCRCHRCLHALRDPRQQEYAACLALVDTRTVPAGVWLLDATPDIRWQLAALYEALGPDPMRMAGTRPPDGIFLTHAHMGHVGGLMQLGPEGMAVWELPVHASPALAAHLYQMPLWAPLMEGVDLRPLWPGHALPLGEGLSLTPLLVPHRDETSSGTYAFLIRGPQRSLLYLPDIDSWEEWPEAEATLAAVDVAVVDATFFSHDELGTRRVHHPPVAHTLELFAPIREKLVFTHINHTNPILDDDSAERAAVLGAGATIAEFGMRWVL